MTATEFLSLQALALRPGVVKSRSELGGAGRDDRTVDGHMKRLRKKFKAVGGCFAAIKTLYGRGYYLNVGEYGAMSGRSTARRVA